MSLQRFLDAQRDVYDRVLVELRAGAKTSHWMWFIFPQIAGLGHSAMAQRYAIGSAKEAREYLEHPLLGTRLRECTGLVLQHQDRSAEAIFGSIDAMKLRSCLTLFAKIAVREEDGVFAEALQAFFGEPDALTLRALGAAA